MSWVKLDDRFPEHRKVEDLSDAAFRLHVSGMCWTASKEKDGLVTKKAARKLGAPSKITELVEAGLWIELDDGDYEIHDYLEYNPSHDQLEAKRAAARERMRSGRSGVSDGDGSGVTEDVTEGVSGGAGYAPENPAPLPLISQIGDSEGSARNGRNPDLPDKPGSGRPRRWRRVPSDWQPNQVHRELSARMLVNFEVELESFRDHEFKDPKTDPDACFRTWLRNAARFGRTVPRLVSVTPKNASAALVARARHLEETDRQALGEKP